MKQVEKKMSTIKVEKKGSSKKSKSPPKSSKADEMAMKSKINEAIKGLFKPKAQLDSNAGGTARGSTEDLAGESKLNEARFNAMDFLLESF